MAFHDLQLPTDVERGAEGGPAFDTTIMMLGNGHEKRNINWEDTKGSWDIGYGIDSKEQFNRILDFFYTCQGRAHTFRFKDWSDFEIGDAVNVVPQEIGIGTGALTTFQIERRYQAGSFIYHRPIKLIVNGTLRVFKNGVEQMSGWSCNYTTGIITFSPAVANGVAVQVICEFDNLVRFDIDQLRINMEIFNAGSIPQIPIVEVRE